jgi:hypothetical protein
MRWVLMIALLVLPAPLRAQNPQCLAQDYSNPQMEPSYACPGPGEDALVPNLNPKASVPLKLGVPAPWEGILLDKDKVLELGLRISALRRIRWMETTSAEEKLANEVKFTTQSLKADLDLRTSQRESYKQQVTQLQTELAKEKAWYRSWTFGVVVGVVVTTVAVVAVAYAIK